VSARRVHLRITGRVQGVGFRYYTEREAGRLGVTGWVRNLPAGDVEVVAEGTDDALALLVDWCRQGPPSAGVTEVTVQWSPATREFADFRVRR
jgi:acylphosphatase